MEVFNIKLGYIRGVENSRTYKTQIDFLNNSNVDRIFHEKNAGTTLLNEMIDELKRREK